jgi:hypothetical protein
MFNTGAVIVNDTMEYPHQSVGKLFSTLEIKSMLAVYNFYYYAEKKLELIYIQST